MTRPAAVIILVLFYSMHAFTQDTLPDFTVVSRSGRNVISWTNAFKRISQLNVQRSQDSIRNFKTIISVPDPSLPRNGVTDANAPAGTVYYRLFMVTDGGRYLFSPTKRTAPDTSSIHLADPLAENDNQRVVLSDSLSIGEEADLRRKLRSNNRNTKAEKYFIIKKKNLVTGRIPEKQYKRFRDSVMYTTRDTIIFESLDTILIKPYLPPFIYRASRYVYTEKYGNVRIDLPDAESKKYSVQFFEENQSPLFRIDRVSSPTLVIDKSNFIHSGWFWFELYEGNKLKERHRLFIPKEF